MKKTNLKIVTVSGKDDLKQDVSNSLKAADYAVEGCIETNYNHAYAAIRKGKYLLGSAWKFMIEDERLVLVGGMESDLKTTALVRELSTASLDFIKRLSVNGNEEGDVNDEWRIKTLEIAAKNEKLITKGTLLQLKADKSMDITVNGDGLSRLIIADGQGIVAYTEEGRQLQLPKPLRRNYDVVKLPKATQTLSDNIEHGKLITKLLLTDISRHVKQAMYGYHIRSKSSIKNDRDQLIVSTVENGIEKTVALVGGKENMEIALKEMEKHNAFIGVPIDDPVYRDNSMNFVQIDFTKKVEAINTANREIAFEKAKAKQISSELEVVY
jgi:hypothetical protein